MCRLSPSRDILYSMFGSAAHLLGLCFSLFSLCSCHASCLIFLRVALQTMILHIKSACLWLYLGDNRFLCVYVCVYVCCVALILCFVCSSKFHFTNVSFVFSSILLLFRFVSMEPPAPSITKKEGKKKKITRQHCTTLVCVSISGENKLCVARE